MNKKFIIISSCVLFIILFIYIANVIAQKSKLGKYSQYNGIWYSDSNNNNDGTVEISNITDDGFLFSISVVNPHNLHLAYIENRKANFYENKKASYKKNKGEDESEGIIEFIFEKDKLKIISYENELNSVNFTGDFSKSKPVELIKTISNEQKREFNKFISFINGLGLQYSQHNYNEKNLINFACLYIYYYSLYDKDYTNYKFEINNENKFVTIEAKYIEEIIKEFFDISITHQNTDDSIIYENSQYTWQLDDNLSYYEKGNYISTSLPDLLSTRFAQIISLEKYDNDIYIGQAEVYIKDSEQNNDLYFPMEEGDKKYNPIFSKYIRFKIKKIIENSNIRYIITEIYQTS